MKYNFSRLLHKYRSRGIVIDTNLMLLLVVGTYNIRRIGSFKRTLKYNEQIFRIVLAIVERFEQRFVTPNVMTEVDNLARQMRDDEWPALAATFRSLMPALIEVYSASITLIGSDFYVPLGLTDCSVAASNDALIFTDDLPFAARMANAGRDVLNLSHLLYDLRP
jgi:hypothetical protein